MSAQPVRAGGVFRFGNFEFDALLLQLRSKSRTVKLERIPGEILALLIERRGTLVLREEIVEHVWGKSVFLDTDNGINCAIRKIRQVLQVDAGDPDLIQTFKGKGYRFIGEVTDTSEPPEALANEPLAVAPPSPPRVDGASRVRLIVYAVVVLAVVAIVGLSYAERVRRAAPTSAGFDVEQSDLRMKAKYALSKRSADDLERAAGYFEAAIERNPRDADAYAGLASTYALMSGYSLRPQTEFMPKAREAALKAIAIDEHLSEAHAALALILQNYDWDWTSAEREFRRAIELAPNDAHAHHWYAEHLAFRGRFDEALREIDLAHQLDPLSLIIAVDRGAILIYARRYDEAIQQLENVRETEPEFRRAHIIANAYLAKGDLTKAAADVKVLRTTGVIGWTAVFDGIIAAKSGSRDQALAALTELKSLSTGKQIDPALFVDLYAALGMNDEAFAALEEARRAHSNIMVVLKVDPMVDPLRSDPRFNQLLRSVNLAP